MIKPKKAGISMIKDDLMKYCLNDPCSAYQELSQPWSRGDYTFATEGHIMIRIPRLPDVPEYIGKIDVGAVWPKEMMAESCDIPDHTQPQFVNCPQCDGKGTCIYEAGDPPETCDCCDGYKMIPLYSKIEINGVFFSDHLLSLIKDLPDIKIYPVKMTQSLTYPPSYFKFDGGDGLIMPMTGD
jgi:hypothetical protein